MTAHNPVPTNLNEWNDLGNAHLPGHLGIEVISVESGVLCARMPVRPQICAPNGYLHAASVVALADTACGYGTVHGLPDGAVGFTTIELKTNFLGTTLTGDVRCTATRTHSGRTTQVWDAKVIATDSAKTIALFRCTQMILYPTPNSQSE